MRIVEPNIPPVCQDAKREDYGFFPTEADAVPDDQEQHGESVEIAISLALLRLRGSPLLLPEGSSPMTFVLMGNFTQHAVMAGGGASGGSVEYKEYFDVPASVLSDFPTLLQSATFVFVPGDNDGWAASFGARAGTAVPLPRKPVPDLFTSRVAARLRGRQRRR
ncbi:hypothetical protein Hte_005733 [Hypoxylon texense]